MAETTASVVYRTGRLTEEDYDEAIEALILAKAQAGDSLAGHGAVNCAVCEDGDHTAESCHHNPLVLARRWAAARGMWNCYHCSYIAYSDEEALAHFGRSDDEVARCLVDKVTPAQAAGIVLQHIREKHNSASWHATAFDMDWIIKNPDAENPPRVTRTARPAAPGEDHISTPRAML